MRKILAALPWTVMATSAVAQMRSAHVSFTHFGPLKEPCVRVIDECFFPISELEKIGWKAQEENNYAEIDAEGTHFRVPVRIFSGQVMIPLRRAVSELGGESEWDAKHENLQVFALIKSLKLIKGKLQVESSLNVRARFSMLDDPNRVVIDIQGAKLAPTGQFEIESGSRLGQFAEDTVRVVWEHNQIPDVPSLTRPSRGLSIDLFPNDPPPVLVKPSKTGADPTSSKTTGDEASGGGVASPDSNPTTPTVPGAKAIVNEPTLVVENSDSLKLAFKLGRSLTALPKINRPNPSTVELTFPNAESSLPADFKLNSPSILKTDSKRVGSNLLISLKLSRPMGAELFTSGSNVELRLIKPKVGDGKIAGKIIVIDPGHGGKDPGSNSPDHKVFEKDLTLSIAKLVSDKLTDLGATVIMTRKTDVYIPLGEQPLVANRNNADFFISIHINSNSIDNKISGSTVYFHMQNPLGQLLADCLIGEIAQVSGIPNRGAQSDRRLYTNGLAVLRKANQSMPAALVEVGYI
ncbi:MAG: N-acetylmuramoyl-L-alanine amidase, partial [Verrucomicrobiota bacterium]